MAARAAEMAAFSSMQHTSGIFSDMTVDGPIIGTLVAIIDRAKNLPNRRAMGKQDPYCAARLGKEAKKTTTDKRGGQTPRWDQELRFTVHDSPDYHRLKVSLFNDDKKTELIGETWVNLESVLTPGGGQSDSWHGLNCKGKYAGDIRIELTYYDTRPKAEKAPVEKKRESTRPDAPTASGPREATPVKRRPLPSDPTRASPSPVHTPEQRGLQGMQSGPREYGSSRRQNEPTPTNQRRSHHPDTPNRRPVPDTSTLTGTPISSHNTPQQQQQHGPPQDPYSTSPNPRLSSSNLAQYREDGFDMSYTAPKPYEVQPVDSQPQHSSNRTMSQDDFRSSRGHSQSHPPEPPHSYSAPIVPTQHTYDPADGYSQDPYQDPSFHVAPLRMNQKFNRSREQIAPHDPYLPPIGQGDPYHGRRLSSMQPTVEDEDDIPPPPPVHRSDASTIPQPVYDDTPAPLNMTRYRSASPQPGYDYESPQPYGVDDYGMHDHTERRYTNPSSRPVSRGDAMVPSPIRQDTVNIPSSLVAGFDPFRQHRDSVSYQAPPSYETPPRLRQHSEVDYRTPPQYDTPSHAHQLVRHQQLPSTESPNYYPHDPPEQPQRTSPVQETLPLIRPRATSPGMNPAHSPSPADNRMSRIPARTMPTRKSVSPRPQPSPSDTQERRLSGVPFGPDSFDVLNPTVAKPGTAEDERPGSSMEMNESGQIVTFSGRVVDASDHLPVDNWAPEPERKGGEKERPIRTRPQLNGSRDLEAARQREDKYRRDRAERERIRDAANVTFGDSPSNALVTTRHNFSNHSSPANSGTMVLADHDYTPPGSGNRSRLQKRGGRPTSYATPPAEHTSPSHIPMPRSHILRERENPSGFGSNYGYGGNRHSVAAPPVPAKIPLDAGPSPTAQSEDTMALSLELQSIDIGPGSGGRRPRPKQTPRRFGF